MKYFFTITRYKNGVLDYTTDDVNTYPTKETAIDQARYVADYWKIIHNGKMEKTETGAVVRFRSETDRYETRYEVQ